MNDSSSNQDTGNSGVPPVITGAPISKPPPLPGDASSASLFLPRSAEVTLKEILSRIEARQRRLRLWLKLAACWAAAALLGGCLLVIQRENGWTSTATLPSVAFVAVIAALVVLLRSRRGSADPRQLASQIEARHPELDGLLLTAAQQHADGGGELNFLQERLIREAMAHSRKQDWAAIVPRSHLALAQLANVAALVILVLVLGQFRGTGGHHLFTKTPNSEISVTPGDATIERGSSLVILARFGQALPPNVDLVIASAQGKDNRIPLVKSLADPVFGGSLSEVASNLTYHVEYGGRRTRDFKVTVFDYPRLERADADLVFPDYTGQKAQHIDNTRRVTAVEGSQVSFALQFNKPVASAHLVPKDKERASVALTLETNQPGALLKQFPLADSQTYDLQLVDSEGRTNKMPAQFVFAVLTNRTPELRLASPRGDMRPSPLEEISFEGTVWDDFGVQAYGLGYQLAGEEPKFIELGGKVASKEKRPFQHLLSLEKLGVQSDQLISWFVWADDIGPDGQVRRTPGDLFFGEVRPFDEVFREGEGMEGQQDQQQNQMGGGQMGGQAGRLAELQKQIISATWRLQRENSAKKPASSGSKEERAPAKLDQTRSPAQPVPQETYYVTARQFAGQLAPGRGTTRNASPRNPTRSGRAATNSPVSYSDDATVVRDSQEQALEQARQTMEQQQNPQTTTLWANAIKRMEDALKKLDEAKNSPTALPQALTEEQAAYQALLKLQEHEYNVVRSRNQRQQGGGGSRDQQMQRELDQLDLTQPENRYETQRQAQAPQTAQRQEQLQVMNRLQELARRQQDLNSRLKELQTELQEARTPEEREDAQRRLKRLQEEEQQMLADVDELRQRMDRPENQSNLSEARQQLEQTRSDIQRAAQAANQNDPSQALASGTRAQRQLQDLRDQMRKENSSQFADDLREMRGQARELDRQQEDILKKMEQEAQSDRKSLADSPERKEMLDQLARQRERMTNIVDRATEISQQAETAEPLLSQQLYDTVRTFSQESARNVGEVQDQLLNRGIMTRNIYDQLKDQSKQDGTKLLDVTSELLRMDFLSQANDTGQRSQASIDNLRRGVERAAGSVLGDDTEALKQAQQQLDQLTDQLRNEIQRAQGNGTNQERTLASRDATAQDGSNRRGGNAQQPQSRDSDQSGNQAAQAGTQNGQNPDRQGARSGRGQGDNDTQSPERQSASAQQQDQGGQQANAGNRRGGNRGSGQTDQNQNGGGNEQPQLAQNDQQGGQRGGNQGGQRGGNRQGGQRRGGNPLGGPAANGGDWGGEVGNVVDQLLNRDAAQLTDPLTGGDFVQWSDGLRGVEEMVEIPDLRNGVAVVRERARVLRQDYRRTGQTPDWAVVQLQVLKPLVEVRNQIADELARRESKEALVPIDRDPVPNQYSELVRRYYEELGKDQSATPK